MKIVVYGLAFVLGLLGLVFLLAAGQGNAVIRIVIGLVCMLAAGALVALMQLKPVHQTHVHEMKVDLAGDVSLEKLTCNQCSASLSERSVEVRAGAVFVKCEFCGAEYQIEEAPKW